MSLVIRQTGLVRQLFVSIALCHGSLGGPPLPSVRQFFNCHDRRQKVAQMPEGAIGRAVIGKYAILQGRVTEDDRN